MAYEKRLCVLKQIKKGFSADGKTLSGAVHAERLGETLTITLKLLDVAPVKEGKYLLAVAVGEKKYLFDLSQEGVLRIEGAPSLNGGFSALLCFVRGEVEPVAFGSCTGENGDYSKLLLAVTQEPPKRKRVAVKKEEIRLESGYHDEAIAEDNYYEREKEHERTDTQNETVTTCGEQKKEERTGADSPRKDETDESVRPFLIGGELTYYNSVKERLDLAMKKYPRDERLKGVFPQSEWVNVEGTLLGIIYEEGKPRYLCVAKEENTAEFENRAHFVPFTPFSQEEGMYVLFQNAQTGEIVTLSDA